MKKILYLTSGILATSLVAPTIISCSKQPSASNIELNKINYIVSAAGMQQKLPSEITNSDLNNLYINNSNSLNAPLDPNYELIANIQESFDASGELVLNVQLLNKTNNTKSSIKNVKIDGFKKQPMSLKQSQQEFFKIINDMTHSDRSTVMFASNASLVHTQMVLIHLINYYLMKEDPSLKTNNNKLIHILQNNFYTEGNTAADLRFNVEYLKGISYDNSLTLEEMMSINISDSTTSLAKDSHIFKDQKVGDHMASMISSVNSTFDKIQNDDSITNKKTDSVLSDLAFSDFLLKYNPNNPNDPLYKIFKNSARIVLVSDGAAHTARFERRMVSAIENSLTKLYTNEEAMARLNEIQTLSFDQLKQQNKLMTINDMMNFCLMRRTVDSSVSGETEKYNFIQAFHYDPSYIKGVNLENKYKWNIEAFSLNHEDYGQALLTNDANKQEFNKKFTDMFHVDYSSQESIERTVFENGFKSYDPNKKNAIFFGSSLFTPLTSNNGTISRLENFANLRNHVQDIFVKFAEIFPPEEYNIIFKFHPVFKGDTAVKLSQLYTAKLKNDPRFIDPIIFNPKIPFETLISTDYYEYKKFKDGITQTNNSIIFRGDKPEEWSKYFGLQATTSLIQTTRLFYESTFNLSLSQTEKLIPLEYFPIPSLFLIISREGIDPKTHDKYAANMNSLNDVYKTYNPSYLYPELNLSQENDRFKLNHTVSTYKFVGVSAFEKNSSWTTVVSILLVTFAILGSLGIVFFRFIKLLFNKIKTFFQK